MTRIVDRLLGLGLVLLTAGCGSSANVGQSPDRGDASRAAQQAVATNLDPTAVAQNASPEHAVYEFLEAMRTGDDAKVMSMLSRTAREKAAASNQVRSFPASDTAKFTIGAVEHIGDGGARVATEWTDRDPDDEWKTYHYLWVLRDEDDGWRVVGVAATIFEGEPPLLLNFEDPEEMVQKQQWAMEEMERRATAETYQAQTPDSGEEVRR